MSKIMTILSYKHVKQNLIRNSLCQENNGDQLWLHQTNQYLSIWSTFWPILENAAAKILSGKPETQVKKNLEL